MNDRDGIYLNSVWICPPDAIATIYQGNDLTKPATLQTSFTNSFRLPDSINVRRLTGNAEQLDSGSDYPYKLIPAFVIDNGELTFQGVARLSSFGDGWEAALYEEKRNLFARLGRSIRTADLARFDHPWTVEGINALATSTDGVCYPVLDYGLLSANVLPLDNIYPGVYVHTLLRQMLKEEGYKLVGQLANNPLFKRLVIPFSEQEGTNHDEKWAAERKARVAQDDVEYEVNRTAFDSGRVMDTIQPFRVDDRPTEGYSQGALKNYDINTYTYVCDSPMRVKVDSLQTFRVSNNTGSIEFMLIIEKNGNNIHQEYFSTTGPYNLLFSRNDKLEIHKTISCQKNDRLQIRFISRRRTTIAAFRTIIYRDSLSSWVSFTPDLSIHTGDNWPVARNLPDLKGVDLLVDFAHIFGGTWKVDSKRKEVSFGGLTETINNTANAVDWSNRLDTDFQKNPTWTPALDPYAQVNYLKWKETDETKATDGGLNYGDGQINVSAETLDADTELFELSFAASTNSKAEIIGYGNPLLIKTRTISGSGDNVSIGKQNTTARLILVSPELATPVKSKRLASDGVTVEDVELQLKPCWFGMRPNISISAETAFCLCFSPVKNMKGEVTLITLNYAGLMRVLRRMRVLGTSARLLPEDIASLDFNVPVRLQRVQLSNLTLSDGFYYLNVINNYRANQPCTITLIAF